MSINFRLQVKKLRLQLLVWLGAHTLWGLQLLIKPFCKSAHEINYRYKEEAETAES